MKKSWQDPENFLAGDHREVLGGRRPPPLPILAPRIFSLWLLFPLEQTDKHRVLPELSTFFWTITEPGEGVVCWPKVWWPLGLASGIWRGAVLWGRALNYGVWADSGRKRLNWMNCGTPSWCGRTGEWSGERQEFCMRSGVGKNILVQTEIDCRCKILTGFWGLSMN